MKNYTIKIFALLFMFGVFITSCDVDLTTPEVDSETTEDNALGERAVGDVFGMVNTSTGGGKAAAACPDRDYNPISKKLTLTFPEDGCEGSDGVEHSGVITAQFSGFWTEASSSVAITFENYKRDGNTLNGTINVVYTLAGDNPEFTMIATNMSLTFADGKKTTWESSNTYTWLEGVSTLFDRSDDSYSITGITSGTARNGKEFSRVSTNLVTTSGCKWFTSGNLTLNITEDGESEIYNMTFKEPCGTVTILYKGISVTRTFE